jgi:FAD/FMN-containing dehydrogenase
MSSLDGVVKELEEAVGKGKVATDEDALSRYSADASFCPPKKPDCVVTAQNREEVQRVVQIANNHAIPVVPKSSRVGFYGRAIPEEGGIILDLSAMNRILRIDERNKWVLFEAGVTWGQLQEELGSHGFQALNPLLPHKDKSVMTSTLEKEPAVIPKAHFDEPIRTMEMILPTGELFRTGSMAMTRSTPEKTPDETESHLAYAGGPGLDWFRLITGACGSYGIVTLMNVKIYQIPALEKLYFIPFQSLKDVIDPTYTLQRREVGNECFVLNSHNLACILGEGDEVRKLKEVLPPFVVIINLSGSQYFPEERIAYEEEALEEIARHYQTNALPTLPRVSEGDFAIKSHLKGPWNKEPYWKFQYKGSACDILFLATLDRVEEFTQELKKVAAEHGYPLSDIGVYVQPKQRARICHVEYTIPFNPEDEQEKERAEALFLKASERLIGKGAFFHRPYGPWAEMVYSRTGTLRENLRKVKSVLDPNNVLNPGKLNM